VGDPRCDELVEFASDLDLGAEADLLGNVAALQAIAAAGPLVGKIQIGIDEDRTAAAMVRDDDADLAVVGLAQAVAPLAGDADGVLALLGEAGPIEDQDAVGIAEIPWNLTMELPAHLGIFPLALAGEALEALRGPVVGDRNGFDALSMQVARQPLQVHLAELGLLLPIEERREGSREAVKALDQAFNDGWVHPRGLEEFLRDVWNRQRSIVHDCE